MDGVGHRAFLHQQPAGLVPDLAAPGRDPEQLVHRDRREERHRTKLPGNRGGGQRFAPELTAAVGHAPFRESPRRGLEDEPVVHVPVREDVLDVRRQLPQFALSDEIDRRGGDHLVLVVDQLEQRFLNVPRPGFLEDVAAPDFFLARQIFERRHQALAELTGQHVVEVLRCARARACITVLQRPAYGADVAPRVDQRQQQIHPVRRALDLVVQRSPEQRIRRQLGARE